MEVALLFWLCWILAGDPHGLSERAAAKTILREIGAPRLADSFWGVAVYAPWRDRLIFEHHARQNFRPASNLKILTTLLALEYLGPDFRFETEFAYTGEIRAGVLEGDLIVFGSGDPSISGNYDVGQPDAAYLLGTIADKLSDLGIEKVRGDILGVLSFFDERGIQKSWEWDDIGLYYATPVGPLALGDGWIDIRLTTDEKGVLSHRAKPASTPGLTLEFELTHEPGEETLGYSRAWNTNSLVFKGNLPPCSDKEITISAWDPAMQFLASFKDALEKRGIALEGVCRTLYEAPTTFQPVAAISSLSLADLSQVLMKHSQNHYADCFLKTTARMVTGEGSFESGASVARELLRHVARWSAPGEGFSMRDGSGLSAQNYLKPIQIVELLLHGWNQPYRAAWVASFPVLGAEGTLAGRGIEDGLGRGRVWAKTGYIFRSRSLSGYLLTWSGEPLIFSFMTNNYSVPTSEINRVQDQLCEILIRLKPNRRAKQRLRLQAPALLSPLVPGPSPLP